MTFNSTVTITKPRAVVWKVITNPVTWKTWYGGELRKVDPAWQMGARLVWAAGSTSEVKEFVPLELLVFGGDVRSRISLKDGENGSTVLEYSETIGGHLSVSNPSAKKAQCDSTAKGLKAYVEGRGGSKCFIATAAYGSPTAYQVVLLRDFRNNNLQHTAYGYLAIRLYEIVSPPFAAFIAKHEFLRSAVRILLLKPLVALIQRWNR